MIQKPSILPLALSATITLASPTGLLGGYAEDWAKMKDIVPRSYVCAHATTPIGIDGRLDDRAWKSAPWTDSFVDIEGSAKPKPRFRTRAKMLWDDHYFYVAAELEEPHVWGTLTNHDAVIFHDPDFEVFIDPDGDSHDYYEFEMNALNSGWDLLLKKPYKDGGPALNEWEIPGLKTAVHINGTLNNPSDRDKGWTVEIAFPWKVLGELANHGGQGQDAALARLHPRIFRQPQRRAMARELLTSRMARRCCRRKISQGGGPEGGQLGLVAAGHRRHASSGEVGLRPIHAA